MESLVEFPQALTADFEMQSRDELEARSLESGERLV
jgi:hypothetical protein